MQTICQKITTITGINLSRDTIKEFTIPRTVSVENEWAKHMFFESKIPTRISMEYAFLYIDPSGKCIWLYDSGPTFPDIIELSNSLILCCRTADKKSKVIWVLDIIVKCGVSIWHLPFLDRQNIFADTKLSDCFKMLEFKPVQNLSSSRNIMNFNRRRGGLKYHSNIDFMVYMYRYESLFPIIKLRYVSTFRQPNQPEILIVSPKEFICTHQHPLLLLHQTGQLMPLINRLCGSGALCEDISKTSLHLYTCNHNKHRSCADVELAKMFRGLIIDKQMYPPKIVCLPLSAFETIESEVIANQNKQIFEVSLKMDGTSIILARYQGKIVVATKNKFKSKRVDLVKALLHSGCITKSFRENYTYICEYIGGLNCRVIKYPFEGLCLLAVIDNKTGVELDYESRRSIANSLGFITPATVFCTEHFNRIITCFSRIYKIVEGVVARAPDGKKFKIKSPEWKMDARALYSTSPMSAWTSQLKSFISRWNSLNNEESPISIEISEWFLERACDLLKFQKHLSSAQLDSNAIYIATCYRFDVLQCRSAYRLHTRIIRNSVDHGMEICNNISICNTCIAIWFFLKPYSNYICWETCSIPSKDRIKIVLEDDWHHIDTTHAVFVQWLGNSDVMYLIFQYMDHEDLSICRQVCKHWHLYINQHFEDLISYSFNAVMKLSFGETPSKILYDSQSDFEDYRPVYSHSGYGYGSS